MNADARNMTMTEKADAAFKQAAAKVIERARQTGTPVVLWENGRIVKRSWEELISHVAMARSQTREGTREEETESAAGQAPVETAQEPAGNHEAPH